MSNKLPEASILSDEFDAIEQDSVRWFMRVHHGNGPFQDEEEFEQWLATSKEHQLKYEAICSLMKQSEEFTDDPAMAAYFKPMLTQSNTATHVNVQQEVATPVTILSNLFARITQGTKQIITQAIGHIPTRPFAILAAVFVCVIYMYPQIKTEFGAMLLLEETEHVYQTGIGEVKTVTLDDGSLLRMNTRTVLKVVFTEQQRKIILDQGQANFIVAKNRDKPFVVLTGLGQVVALGTEFDVYKIADKMTVSLIEGKIQIHQLQTGAAHSEGKQGPMVSGVIVEAEGDHVSSVALTARGISPIELTDSETVMAWHHNKIIFNEQSLVDVLVELNRYSEKLIVLQNVIREDERITAVFPTDIPTALTMIKTHFDLEEVPGRAGEIILIPSNQSNV